MSEYYGRPSRTNYTHRSPSSKRKARGYENNGHHVPTRLERQLAHGDRREIREPEPLTIADEWFAYLVMQEAGITLDQPSLTKAAIVELSQDKRFILDRNYEPYLAQSQDDLSGMSCDGTYIYPAGEFEIYGSQGGIFRNTARGRRMHNDLRNNYYE